MCEIFSRAPPAYYTDTHTPSPSRNVHDIRHARISRGIVRSFRSRDDVIYAHVMLHSREPVQGVLRLVACLLFFAFAARLSSKLLGAARVH